MLTHARTHAPTHGRRLDWYTISSPLSRSSGELKNNLGGGGASGGGVGGTGWLGGGVRGSVGGRVGGVRVDVNEELKFL